MKRRFLIIVPKNDHKNYTQWLFHLENKDLANHILQDYYPDGSHEIIEIEADEFDTTENFEDWVLKNCGYE